MFMSQSRHILLSVPGPHGHQPPGDCHHHQCPAPQLHEVPGGSTLGEGGGPQTHRHSHLLQVTGGAPALQHVPEGQT